MASYIVTYDLNKEAKRPDILKGITGYDGWAESTYAITTSGSAKAVYGKLAKHLDSTDNCYVISLSEPYWGQVRDNVEPLGRGRWSP